MEDELYEFVVRTSSGTIINYIHRLPVNTDPSVAWQHFKKDYEVELLAFKTLNRYSSSNVESNFLSYMLDKNV